MDLKSLFQKDFGRTIETVIKADDQSHVFQEVEEYVITQEIEIKLNDLFDLYNRYDGVNGVWISGFFGSGKSHLLKILSYVLENRTLHDQHLGEIFADKVTGDAKLKADIKKATQIPSESILFNIDQKAQNTGPGALLQVFYKVLHEHQGFYGFQPHIAKFEHWLTRENKYKEFKEQFADAFGKPWTEARKDYVDPLLEDTVASVCAGLFDSDSEKYEDILERFEDAPSPSIEDFAEDVATYIESKPKGFRLNFYVDEVGQFVADNTRLMLNLQTIAESLATRCKGQSWIFVTSQEDLDNIVGDETALQSDDFSKIQGRFKIRLPLTSANVDEVIERRLLEKNENGKTWLTTLWKKEKDNLKTLLSFSEAGIQFRSYQDEDDFIAKYPFIPYQFDLFQQCIKALSGHNAFQGKHASVGERSMLGVFQEVLKKLNNYDERYIIPYDLLFEGLRSTLRTEVQNTIILAERQLESNPLALRVLKTLFMVKYFDSFRTTLRNVSVLLLDSLDTNPTRHQENVREALNLLEQQSYIQRNGEFYEFLTDKEKDVEQEIKNTEIDSTQVTELLNSMLFDGVIRETKIQYIGNKQFYEFTRKVDGVLFGREKELTIEIITPNSDRFEDERYFQGQSMGNPTHVLFRLAPHSRLVQDLRLFVKTDKYIKQTQSTSNNDTVKRILMDKSHQNQGRRRELIATLNELLARATVYLNGTEHRVNSTSDGKTKVITAFQDLVVLAYSKLQLLGNATYDESRLQNIMRGRTDDLFKTDEDQVLTVPEKEVLNYIRRRKKQNDRTTLNNLREVFTKKPYGWPVMAIWCMSAMLFKRGKIEARQDSSLLDDNGFLEALMNNWAHPNTLISPQIEFDQSQIRKLKTVHQELFHESNPYQEAKEVAECFTEKAALEQEAVLQLLAQKNNYPFVAPLEEFSEKLRKLQQMDYAALITTIGDMEDALLNLKEDKLDPIKQFMNSQQKEIYDRVAEFRNYNQANFSHIDSEDKERLSRVKDDPEPYRGDTMKRAKQAMDSLEDQVRQELQKERESTKKFIEKRLNQLQDRGEFKALSPDLHDQILRPLYDELETAGKERFIGNLQAQRGRIGDIYTRQLNKLMDMATPKETEGPKAEFIKQSRIVIPYEKPELETEEDVDSYVSSLREAMLKHIRKNRNIILD
ncbi:BREX system P-loop protein BrxC [Balneolales bacterium ANBcel1]|nr:BREX system P-loop protein BrxC [Balneolales bacterium ANBcel1]